MPQSREMRITRCALQNQGELHVLKESITRCALQIQGEPHGVNPGGDDSAKAKAKTLPQSREK
jgi:hypothetical protein